MLLPKTYSHCPKKYEARHITIIEPYRLVFGKAIPKDKQYWSMSATCANSDGVIKGSELDQLLQSKLITENQFNGVDKNPEVFEENSKYSLCNWYRSDFLIAMEQSHDKGLFNPAIINADLVNMPFKASNYIGKILGFLNGAGLDDVMIIANIVLKSYNRFSDVKELLERLNQNPSFDIAWRSDNWRIFGNQLYAYDGTDNERGHSNTTMGSVVFIPRKMVANV